MLISFDYDNVESKKFKKKKIYRNPIFVAKEYQSLIDSGKVKNQGDLARKLKVSRARISQVLKLLKLPFYEILRVEAFGDPMLKPHVTEQILRNFINKNVR